LRQLLQELADTLYGDGRNHSLDFPSWKKALIQQFNPFWRGRRNLLSAETGAVGLPALNPQAPPGLGKEVRSIPSA
jgi:hypothetical protein